MDGEIFKPRAIVQCQFNLGYLLCRIVDPDLKNLCAGVTSVLVAAFGLLPAPIFVGAIVDSTCRLWQTKPGGGRGYCLFYDTDQFRWKFFLTGACFKLIIVILDSVVSTIKQGPFLLFVLRNKCSQ